MYLATISTLFFIFSVTAQAQEKLDPYWEFGAGFGYAQYTQYPSSSQSRYLFLPFPTFQYRGEVLRADDRDGAHAYLLKSTFWTLELSGAGYLPVDSSLVEARNNMENVPLIFALGPQILSKWNNDFQFGLSTYQTFAADLERMSARGQFFQAHVSYRWQTEVGRGWLKNFDQSYGKVSVTAKAATKEFMQSYFDVGARDVTATRNLYESRGGYLNHEITYFQTIKSGFAALYLGLSYSDFSLSANRPSPLHRADRNFAYVAGFTYVLGRSSKAEVPEEDRSGLFNKYKGLSPF